MEINSSTRSAHRTIRRAEIAALSDEEVLEGLKRNGNRAVSTYGEECRNATQNALDYKNEALNRRLV